MRYLLLLGDLLLLRGLMLLGSNERVSTTLQSADHILQRDCLAAKGLLVKERVVDHRAQEGLHHPAGIIIDVRTDALHTCAARKTTKSRLRNPLDLITEGLLMALRSTTDSSLPLGTLCLAGSGHRERADESENRRQTGRV